MKKILPEKSQQIAMTHAKLIHLVVMACGDTSLLPQLDVALRSAEQNGWLMLVKGIRKILSGRRDEGLLKKLDEEDYVILKSILEGLQNPALLPDMNQQGDAGMAAPGLAAMIHAAATGDMNALKLLGDISEQMVKTEGSMRQLGGIIRMLINDERDLKTLTRGMDERGEKLVLDILEELGKLNPQ